VREVVDDHDLVAFGLEPVDQVRAEEPGATGHHHEQRILLVLNLRILT
jgi:hypothetical protein